MGIFHIVPNKSFGDLLNISPMNHIYTKSFCSELPYIEVWFTDQPLPNPLELEHKTNFYFSYWWKGYIMRYSIEPKFTRDDLKKILKTNRDAKENMHTTRKAQQIIDELLLLWL